MKKGFVALLVVLAIVVLVSPGIVGRLAEQSMDENLDWAAAESQEVTVTSQGFDRGWFSSEGQHRVAIRDGELRDALLGMAAVQGDDEIPDLVIDTRLDHGLVPFSSMARARGSLMPGLGSAVSTLSLEFPDGVKYDLPGTIYSKVGLTGDLESNLILTTGSFSEDGDTATWGDVDIVVTISPTSSIIGFDGAVDSLSFASVNDNFDIGKITFSGNQRQTRFGFSVGDATITVASVTILSAQGAQTIGPLSVDTDAKLDGDRVSGRGSVRLDNLPVPNLGAGNVMIDITLTDMDGAALGNLARALDDLGAYISGDDIMIAMEPHLQRLLASGFELDFDQIDISLPQGTLATRLTLKLAETDLDRFAWPSVLLALDATLDVSMPAELVDIATATDPQFNAAIGMGVLRKNGDVYEMNAEFKKGLLTVNGAPMPIPMPGMQ
ncbi:MAG: YdgA family protein [Gammaproteobacteria bacterium]|nr:YdgA family protein [Gammaproteobacteria bacterium]MDH3372123.1 YdgA family protein [Gammaproteobacteria bacterium]MDH3409085.1 YdgA family protein [Gammaproteobacteria bacterium]MDH3552116.1 YdgA family protein [Gammaproteobacteria bacterium]